MNPPVVIAYFITDHGLGHASRSAAVMAAIARRDPTVRFELFTSCPRWIFEDSLEIPFGYNPTQTDVGIVQRSPLVEDLPATERALHRWLPFDEQVVTRLAGSLNRLGCAVVVSDVSALGIAAARRAALPSVLVENFTWDWIYSSYAPRSAAFGRFADYLARHYVRADLHIQTEPHCSDAAGAVRVRPVSRVPRSDPAGIRSGLSVPLEAKMVLVSMGGVPDDFDFLDKLSDEIEAYLVIPGSDASSRPAHRKIIHLPFHASFFHPDLLAAADLLVGKAGYSTIAEAYFTGTPFAYIPRPQSPETPALEHFIRGNLTSAPIMPRDYRSGRWLRALPRLLEMPKRPAARENGADTAAALILETVQRS